MTCLSEGDGDLLPEKKTCSSLHHHMHRGLEMLWHGDAEIPNFRQTLLPDALARSVVLDTAKLGEKKLKSENHFGRFLRVDCCPECLLDLLGETQGSLSHLCLTLKLLLRNWNHMKTHNNN